MSGILDLLKSDLGKQIINGVSSSTGQSESETSSVLNQALPFLVGAMKKNAATPEGAEGLMNAFSKKHDGSILDNLGDFFKGGVDQNVVDDGQGILGHLLGDKQGQVEQALSQNSSIDSGGISQILKTAAPLLMGLLGKEKQQNNINDSSGLSSLLGGMMGKPSNESQGFLNALRDAEGDGSIMDDVAGMVLGGKKKGGLGSMLGGLFGK